MAETIDTTTRRVVLEMPTWDDEHIPYLRTLAQDIDMPVEQLRRTLRPLIEQGLVTYGPVSNPDTGAPKGSSYWLTESGARLKAELAGETVG